MFLLNVKCIYIDYYCLKYQNLVIKCMLYIVYYAIFLFAFYFLFYFYHN